MTTANEIMVALAAPFPQEAIHWRVGATNKDKTSGIALAYIDARDVMDRLDEVVGASEWSDSYFETPSGRVLCNLAIRLNGEWIVKADGAGDTDVEGEKGGLSDALKRAGVKWGIARYLYRLGADWVPIKAKGRSYVLQSRPKLPIWALPEGQAVRTETEEEQPPPKKEKPNPIKLMEEKLDILTENYDGQEVHSWWTLFLRNCDHAEGAESLSDLKKKAKQWLVYKEFKHEANRAFDAGFSEEE